MPKLERWDRIGVGEFAGCAGAMLLVLIAVLASEPGFVPILDHTNLALHEAGHVIFGVFGCTAALYGGTLGQLVFPLAAMTTFWWRRKPGEFAVCGVWLCENLYNIARYMADARAQQLPLVGGGEHDWLNIFTRWNALASDTRVARVTTVLGWLGFAGLALWLTWRFLRDRRTAPTPPPSLPRAVPPGTPATGGPGAADGPGGAERSGPRAE